MLILSAATAEGAPMYVGVGGFVLWSAAYIFFICRGWKDKSYGVPLVSVCLNFTWELYFALLCRPEFLRVLKFLHVLETLQLLGIEGPKADLCTARGMEYGGLFVWLVLDTVILFQLFKYGWNSEPTLLRYVPKGRRRVFNVFLCVLLLMALYWQYAFVNIFTDQDGTSLAWLTNFIMSWLFVSSALFRRPDARGLSFYGGVAMFLGSFAFALKAVLTGFSELTAWPPQFTIALMSGVLMVNIFYLYVLVHKPRGAEQRTTVPNGFTAVAR